MMVRRPSPVRFRWSCSFSADHRPPDWTVGYLNCILHPIDCNKDIFLRGQFQYLAKPTVQREMLVVIIFGGFKNITI